MPEPITIGLLVGGFLLLGRRHPSTAQGAPTGTLTGGAGLPLGSAASGTGPTAPLATNSSNVNGSLANAGNAAAVPSLAAMLDDSTAILMRQYAAANPVDFQTWLNRYAANIQLRDDYYFHMVTDPPTAQGGFQLTPQMGISLGAATYKVLQAINGVAAGQNVDLFGVTATVLGRIPDVNPDFVHAMQGLALAYRAFSSALTVADIAGVAAANGVALMDVTSSMLEAAGMSGQLALAPIASFAGVLMVAGLCIDIAFTIAGNEPDIQKAIDVALDTAAIACLFIPVVGWVIAIVIELVKFIIDIFGGDLFGGGLSHAQREALEAARYGENLNPMFPQVANAYTPRELFQAIIQWGTGYCGGVHVVAMGVNLVLNVGDVLYVGGKKMTVSADVGSGSPILTPPGTTQMTLGIVEQGCYSLQGGPFAAMTNDEFAWALGMYATKNGIIAEAQVGIAEAMKAQFNTPVQNMIMARAAPMANILGKGTTLDQFDMIAREYRAQAGLNVCAVDYGWDKWQDMLSDVIGDEWARWTTAFPHGTLTDFARANGYPHMFEFRAAAFSTYQSYLDRTAAALGNLATQVQAVVQAASGYYNAILYMQQLGSSAP